MLSKRILWHVSRTPAAKLIKGVLRVRDRREIEKRRKLALTLPCTESAREVARQLALDGFAWANDLVDRQSLIDLENATLRGSEPNGPSAIEGFTDKKFWSHLLEREMVDGSLPIESPFARFALQPSVLSALATYYGELPRLDYVALTLSRHAGDELKYSQLWHRDHDDTRVVKLFVYLTDVDDADGPFTFIPGRESDRVGFSRHSHRPDTGIRRKVDLGSAVQMKGPRLSAFLVETSRCLHMGSRVAPGHERLMYTATYISVPRIFPERPKPFFRLQGNESAIERTVLLAG